MNQFKTPFLFACTIIILSFVSISSIWYDDQNTAYALRQVAGQITVEIKPGETKSIEWGLASDDSNNITAIQLSAQGDGAEFISFENNSINISPSKTIFIPVTIIIPDDYPGGITLSPKLYATEFGEKGGATVMNIQMLKIPRIIISLNEDSSLHVDWEQIQLEKLQQQDAEAMLLLNDDASTISADSQQATQQQSQGFSIISETKDTCEPGVDVLIDGKCQPIKTNNVELVEDKNDNDGGGCLIATATYGTELSPQVQMLRELRDGTIIPTESGNSFMNSFNEFYYSFSPYIADYARENLLFKEIVKLTITPMMSSLSLLNHVNINTESEMITYGMSIIILNLVMYIGVPIFGIYKINNLSHHYRLSSSLSPSHTTTKK